MKQPPREASLKGCFGLKENCGLAGPPVGAARQSQSRDRCESDRDPTHKLHGVPPSYGGPQSGDRTRILGGPHTGDKPPNRSTSFGLEANPAWLTFKGSV